MGISDKVPFSRFIKIISLLCPTIPVKITIFMTEGIGILKSKKTHFIPIIKQASEIISLSHNMLQRVRFHCGL